MELKDLLKEQEQAMVYSGQSIAEVLQNNPHSWILESCDLEVPGWDLGGQQTANVKIRFFYFNTNSNYGFRKKKLLFI